MDIEYTSKVVHKIQHHLYFRKPSPFSQLWKPIWLGLLLPEVEDFGLSKLNESYLSFVTDDVVLNHFVSNNASRIEKLLILYPKRDVSLNRTVSELSG